MDVDGAFEQAVSLFQAGQLDEAERLARSKLKRKAGDAAALHLLGSIAARRGHDAAAMTFLHQAVKARPADAALRSELSAVLHRLGRLTEAETQLRVALELDPTNAAHGEALRKLGTARLNESRSKMRKPVGVFLQEGIEAQNAADFDSAALIYEQVLRSDPRQWDALHLLGVVHREQGDARAAVDLIARAVAERSDEPLFHFNAGAALLDMSQQALAAMAWRRARELARRSGRNEWVVEADRRLVTLEVNELGRHQDWLAVVGVDAVRRMPKEMRSEGGGGESAEREYWCGIELIEGYRAEAGLAHLRRAVVLKPDWPLASIALATAFKLVGRERQAFEFTDRAADLLPESFHWQVQTAINWRWDTRPDRVARALARVERAAAAGAVTAVDLNNLAIARGSLLQQAQSQECLERALLIDPGAVAVRWNLTMCRLLRGDLERGWGDFECRFEARPTWRRDLPAPMWRGEDVRGGTVLLYTEGGLGDALHFVRYAPMVAARGAKVIIECQLALVSLFERIEGVWRVIEWQKPVPPHDYRSPLQSLPGIFGTTLQNIPAQVPYLSAAPEVCERWAKRVVADEGGESSRRLRIGVVWAGSERVIDENDERGRSIELFAPLARVPGVRLYSLQKGPDAAQAKTATFEVTDYTDEIHDFSDTAALIGELDLVVSIDTSVVHLAGALAKEVWVRIPAVPDFRWLLGRSDSPWYPTMRLFRQELGESWEGVMSRVATELEKWAIQRNG